jgi:hypothetical protein
MLGRCCRLWLFWFLEMGESMRGCLLLWQGHVIEMNLPVDVTSVLVEVIVDMYVTTVDNTVVACVVVVVPMLVVVVVDVITVLLVSV